jgi:phosphate transport system protein
MERHFHHDLHALEDRLNEMAGRAETALIKSMEAVKTRDSSLARQVYQEDQAIDRLELEVEDRCLSFLGLQQPVARDLRQVVASIRISNYLERIGDHAVNIAQSAIKLSGIPSGKPLEDLPRMGERTAAMLRDSVSAWLTGNAVLARQICERDQEIDAYKAQIYATLTTAMLHDPEIVPRALEQVLVSRNLERVADLATNIAEEAIFVTEARVIKHHADEQQQPSGPATRPGSSAP